MAGAATPGPWHIYRPERWPDEIWGICSDADGPSNSCDIARTDSGVYPHEESDATFIAAARTALPALLDHVEEQAAALREARAERDAYENIGHVLAAEMRRVAAALLRAADQAEGKGGSDGE